MQYDFVLPDHPAGDSWGGIDITLEASASTLASAELHMRRQASAASEPVQQWSTADGSLAVTVDPTNPARTVVTVAPRVLEVPGVWFMHLVANTASAPKTFATGLLRVRATV